MLTVLLLAIAMLLMVAAPASAHPHLKAATGFVGPVGTPVDASGGTAAQAHLGIQCAVDHGNPNLVDLGLNCRQPD